MYESYFQLVHLLGFSTSWSLLWSFILFTKVPKWWLCFNILKLLRLWVENFFLYKLSQVFHYSEKRLAMEAWVKVFTWFLLLFQPVRFFQSLRSWSMEIDHKRSVLPTSGEGGGWHQWICHYKVWQSYLKGEEDWFILCKRPKCKCQGSETHSMPDLEKPSTISWWR